MIVDGVSMEDLSVWGDQLYKRYKMQADFIMFFGIGALAAYGLYVLYNKWENQKYLNQTGDIEDLNIPTEAEINPVSVSSKPIDLKMNINESACNFIKTQMHKVISDINFSQNPQEIKRLKGKIKTLERLKKEAECQ